MNSSSPIPVSDGPAARARDLLWLTPAIETACAFPADIRRRIGVELVTARHLGLTGAWQPFRGAGPGLSALAFRSDSRAPSIGPMEYHIVCAPMALDMLLCIHAFSRTRGRPTPISDKHVTFTRARMKEVALDREEQRPLASQRASLLDLSHGLFAALGFGESEARELEHRARLIAHARYRLKRQDGHCLTQLETRALLEGRTEELSTERLSAMLAS